MAFFGSGFGGRTFFPVSQQMNGIMCEALVLNVLRSVQFSYLLMKGLKSTSRALRNMDLHLDDGVSTGRGEVSADRGGWQTAKRTRGGIDRGIKRGIGLSSAKTSRRTGNRVIKTGLGGKDGGRGRRVRCARDDVDTSKAQSSKNARNVKENGSTPRSGKKDMGQHSQSAKVNLESQDPELLAQNSTQEVIMIEETIAATVQDGATSANRGAAAADVSVSKVVFSGVAIPRFRIADGALERIKSMKIFVTSVKVVAGIVGGAKKATKVERKVHTPVSGVLLGVGAGNGYVIGFEMARYVVKGAKFSKDLANVWRTSRTWLGIRRTGSSGVFGALLVKEKFLKGLKISDGALTVVKVTKDIGSGLGGTLHHGISNWDLMSRGYDVSNGVMKVLEGFIGFKGGGVIGLVGKGFTVVKGVVVGMGVSGKAVSAMMFCKNIALAAVQGFGFSKTLVEALKVLRDDEALRLTFQTHGDHAVKEVNLTAVRRPALSNVGLDGGSASRSTEVLMARAQKRSVPVATAIYHDMSSSMMFSLASALVAGFDHSTMDLEHTALQPGEIFSLSLPS